ncbi:MAG TPA: GNAT family N-acyltransferase [Vicinamibacterales bacterium]|nr:GNAT family N-acyltransferase [Vicinamibacterales bacterium]
MLRAFSFVLRLPPFRDLCRRARARARAGGAAPFSARALDSLGVRVTTALADLARIPPTGPLVVVANHPHGLIDGLLLLDLVRRVRPDVRVLTNYVAATIAELHDECFFVDPFGGRRAPGRSRAGLRQAAQWLLAGGALVVFPSGEVAYRRAGSVSSVSGTPADAAWMPAAARLAARAGAPMLPVHIEGRNSALFYAAGRVHPHLRTALLPWEMLRQRGRSIAVRVGTPIAHDERVPALHTTAAAKAACEQLARPLHPIEPPLPRAVLAAEIARLPAGAAVLESGAYQVWCARAAQIPQTLRELGRLREVTFRAVGEGTGRATDLDEFDTWYEHLFVWNTERLEVVGAYRIGRTDAILPARGSAGLYTSTLFRYQRPLLERLSPALELGRSFVRAEYQRNSSALHLLWKGIGRLVAREPRYRVLFGPVSISSQYRDTSQQMLMSFLYENHYNRDLGALVRALNPVPRAVGPATGGRSTAADVAGLNRRVSAAEDDGKPMPVLLRQYLRLNATLLAFNIDPQFGDALDALMMVDLSRVHPAILARYVGRDIAEALRAA